jgi:hypothetical protein
MNEGHKQALLEMYNTGKLPEPSRKQIADRIEALSNEIAWNVDRLGHLVLSDEDVEQVLDMIQDMRKEQQTLKLALRNATR